ncbi:MAG: glycosyltransferase 87 family protein [Solirubrobacteraceae bacterium]
MQGLGASRSSVAVRAWGRGERAALWGLLLAGVTIRVVLDFRTAGVRYDLDSLRLVANLLLHRPSRLYAVANANAGYPRWPYPTGFFPFILACKSLASLLGLGFEHVIRWPSILADAAIAWVLQDFLGARAAPPARRLAGAGLVALGPSFIAISGVHGQIDSVAILPAVIALSVWERARPGRRALFAGALIGIGAAIKGVPALMLLALLPSALSWREGLRLVGAAVGVLALAVLPWVIIEGAGWLGHLNYNGGIGLGSLSLVAQPDLALNWLHVGATPLSGVSRLLYHAARPIAAVALSLSFGVLMRSRVRAPPAAVLVWLTVYAFGVTFFMQYMVWGLPFMLMAELLGPVAVLELALLAPVLVIYHGVHHAWAADIFYVAPMLALWAVFTVWLVAAVRRATQSPTSR